MWWSGRRAIGNRLNGVIVKEHGGNGFVINGTGTDLTTCEVEDIGLDGYVVAGSGSVLSGNTATEARHGFIVTGPTTCDAGVVCNLLDTNEAHKLDGDGYVVTAAGTSLVNNDAHANGMALASVSAATRAGTRPTSRRTMAAGFVITGSNNTFINNNKAESNDGVGFNVSGTGNLFNTNAAENNTAGFLIRATTTPSSPATRPRVMMAWDSTCAGPATSSRPTPPVRMASRNGSSGRETSMRAETARAAPCSPFHCSENIDQLRFTQHSDAVQKGPDP